MTEEIGTSNLLRTWANDGTVVVPSNAKIDEGWLRGEQPPHEWMNYIHNSLGQKVNHALSRGAADWNSDTEYLAGAVVNRSGDIWLALATNTNSEPSSGNSNWSGLFSRDNIVGTVSQSAGVPTGAVIERGSNSNGEFVRFADGTQMCWRRITGIGPIDSDSNVGSVFRSSLQSRPSFPAAFLGVPRMSAQAFATSNTAALGLYTSFRSIDDASTTQWPNWIIVAPVSRSDTDFVADFFAIGRWY